MSLYKILIRKISPLKFALCQDQFKHDSEPHNQL